MFLSLATADRTAEQLTPLRQLGDPEADELLERLVTHEGPNLGEDLFGIEIVDRAGGTTQSDLLVEDFFARYSNPPEWLDTSKLQRGQDVFITYAPAAGATLFYVSLVGGFSAPLVTKVLRATGYLTAAPPRVARRLAETGHMICECLLSGALAPGGDGWKAVLRVRFLHARVRRALKSRSYYRANEWV